jgi:glycosyltransferase involved in cell wall biosynthesis
MVSIGLAAVLFARARGIPCAYWMSYLMSEGRRERAMAAGAWRRSPRATLVWLKGAAEELLLYRIVLPLCRHVFVQSEAMRRHVLGRGVPADRACAVPMGVDTEVVRRERIQARRLPGWEGVPVIAYLGSLERTRQPEVLLDMLRRVREQHPSARLLLVGSAESDAATQALRAGIAAGGLAGVAQVTGWLPAAQALELLCGADVAVSYVPRSAVYDLSSPTKLLEYLALGIPAVANDNPDQAEVLGHSGAGWLARSDAVALAEAVGTVLREPAAAARRAAAGPAVIDAQRSYRVLAHQVAVRLRSLRA